MQSLDECAQSLLLDYVKRSGQSGRSSSDNKNTKKEKRKQKDGTSGEVTGIEVSRAEVGDSNPLSIYRGKLVRSTILQTTSPSFDIANVAKMAHITPDLVRLSFLM